MRIPLVYNNLAIHKKINLTPLADPKLLPKQKNT
jgi:hypothetical protein